MNTVRFNKWLLPILILVALGLRIPFRSQYLYHWDSVNFALSLKEYNILAHQPHAPGYFLYSMLGRLFNYFIQDENTSLVWISLLSSLMGIAAIYWLGRLMFDTRVGMTAALLATVSPLLWFYSEIALSYHLEFVFVTIIAGISFNIVAKRRNDWFLLSILIGIIGGIRQNTLFFVLPLWVLCMVFLTWRQRLYSLITLLSVILAWFIPMVLMTGGISVYLKAISLQGSAVAGDSSLFSISQIAVNAIRTSVFIAYGITIGFVIFAWGLWLFIKNWRSLLHDRRAWLLTCWIIPSFAFYMFIYIRQHGHIFTFLPGVILLTAFLIVLLSDRLHFPIRYKEYVLVTPFLLANSFFFLFAPPHLFGSSQLIFQTPSRNTIIETDQNVSEFVAVIRSKFDPSETVIVAGGRYFRHPDYYLRNFQFPSLYNNLQQEQIKLGNNIDTIVLLDHIYPDEILSKYQQTAIPLDSGISLTSITLKDGQNFIISKNSLTIVNQKSN